jgi:hypothetical protein
MSGDDTTRDDTKHNDTNRDHTNRDHTNGGARDVVTRCIQAISDERFDEARKLVHDDMTFVGPLGERNGGDAYFDDMRKMKLKYRVQKVLADGDDVCVLYDLALGGADVLCSGWYKVENGRVRSLRVLFDPRPVLAAAPKR